MNDLFTAQQAKEEALETVEQNADPEWLTAARRIVRYLAKSTPGGFTTDDVWRRLEWEKIDAPHEPRALGAVMRDLANQGVIYKTGEYRNSVRRENHSRPLAVWAAK